MNTAAFATELYARLASQSKGNLFFSPASIETALAMTYVGARGDTAAQMAKTLHFDNDAAKVSASFSELLKTLNNPPVVKGMLPPDKSGRPGETVTQPAYQLFLANALWAQRDYPFKTDFTDLVQKKYGAGLNNVDFGHTEEARTTINDWVAKQTKDRIKELLAKGILGPDTLLVLTNTIYFKSNWQQGYGFAKALTKDGPFHLSADKSADVPLMHRKGSYLYGENDDLQLLVMPYEQEALSMIVLLPRRVDGLAAVEKKLPPRYLVWVM
jgi:serpin B